MDFCSVDLTLVFTRVYPSGSLTLAPEAVLKQSHKSYKDFLYIYIWKGGEDEANTRSLTVLGLGFLEFTIPTKLGDWTWGGS